MKTTIFNAWLLRSILGMGAFLASGVASATEVTHRVDTVSTRHTTWSGIKQFGTAETERGYFSAKDRYGNLYVTGYTKGDLDGPGPQIHVGSFDFYVMKLNPQGEIKWIRQFGSPGEDTALAIAVDHWGYVYVTGQIGGDLDPNDDQVFLEGEGEDDVFLMKLDEYGHVQWLRQFGTTADDAGFGLALDILGNPSVAGYTLGDMDGNGPNVNAGQDDIFVAAFDVAGNQRWINQIGSSEADVAYSTAIDVRGNIYVTGFSYGDLDGAAPQVNAGGMDIIALKLNWYGEVKWIRQFGTAGDDNGYAITADRHRRLYVTGFVSGDLDGNGPDVHLGDSDVVVLKMQRNGDLMWSRQIGTAGNDFGLGVAVDSRGAIYATGTVFGDLDGPGPQAYQGRRDIAVVKFSRSGATRWIRQWGTPGNDWGFHIAVDWRHQLYVTGQTQGDLDGLGPQAYAGSFDLFVLKLDLRPLRYRY